MIIEVFQMEDNLQCLSYKCNLMELFPILMDINTNEDIILSPSQINEELQMSTEERLTKLCKPTRKFRIHTEVNTFSRTPDIIVFQNFKVGTLHETTLCFLNLHPVSRHIKVVTRNSPYFHIYGPTKDSSAKLAPGMSYTLTVEFLPLEKKNYVHHITILTDTESFDVPVYGLGALPLLNFPDQIKLPSTAINIPSEKILILHNFGTIAASYVISAKHPFYVYPCKNLLNAGKFMEMNITCKASALGHIKDCVHISYNDIKLTIPIECEVYDINKKIKLEKDNILFEDTYMGLKRQDHVTFYNQSSHCINFMWKLHKTSDIDKLKSTQTVKNIEGIKELEKRRCNKLEKMDIIDYEGHSRIYEKIFQDEVSDLEKNDLYLYQNSVFDITPLTGEILPNTIKTFIVTFAPNKNGQYDSWAYLDLTGISHRMPLKFSGRGQGPYVSLNVKVLNISDVFLCAKHDYEVAVKNEGNIPGTVVFKDCVTAFDATIKCNPKKIYLPHQDSCDVFIISFYSEIKGTFIETIEFVVKESEEILQFVMTGNVVCPLLKLDIREIDFGVFPFGKRQMKEFLLINDCQVPIEFKIVLEKKTISRNEIDFEPNQGIVNAYSNQPVCVQLNSYRSRELDMNFKVIMWGTEQYSISRAIKYNCICPKITCYPMDIKIKFCFLNYDYKRIIRLKNDAGVAGLISHTAVPADNNNIICTLNKTEFEIQAYEWEEVELSIKTSVLGVSCLPLIFTVAGSEPQEFCRITLDGQGPVVSFTPEEIHFNKVNLLQTVPEQITLINDSPISAIVWITKAPESFFEIDIDEIEIMPDEEQIITLSAYLTDTGKYTGILNVQVDNGESMDIKVFAEGIGHSVLCDPFLSPEYETELLLTYQHFVLPVRMTNLGKKLYKIRWTSNPSIKHLKDKLDEIGAGYCFHIKPQYFELSHMESKTFEIHGLSKDERYTEEEFFCFAIIDKSNKLSLIKSFKIKAKFLEPAVSISKPVLDILVARDDCLELEDNLSIVNELDVPMALDFYTNNDYYIVKDEQVSSHIHQEILGLGTFSVKIKFAPNLQEKRYFKRTGELTLDYMNHPGSFKLEMSTEVCFPTISLSRSELEFNCIPINSYSYKKTIVSNVTFLPVTYSWEILEEFFEIEKLPTVQGDMDFIADKQVQIVCKEKEDEDERIKKNTDEKEEINGEASTSNLIRDNTDYLKEMKKILRPIMQKFVEDSNEHDLLDDIKNKPEYDEYQISNILTIEPFQGKLNPYEYGVMTVGFFPPPNTRIRAKAICKVEGGEHETLSIVGMSCKISYKLDKKFVEFGNKLFCEICENSVILTNKGYCMFNYSVTCHDNQSETGLKPGWLSVSPKAMKLRPGESVTLKIKYFPGTVGEFTTAFKLTIGYLDPLKIKMHGYGVLSQIFAFIPRPIISEQPVCLTYEAISSLSMNYLQSVKEMRIIDAQFNDGVHNCPSKSILQQLNDEWVVISKDDIFPSTMDIDLSVERLLLRQHVLDYPDVLQLHTFTRKIQVIPDFITPAYLLDFGYVIAEKRVCYTVVLLNYGPTPTEVKLLKDGVHLEKNRFKIEFQSKQLNVGETTQFYVIFHPTLRRFPAVDTNVKEHFSLMVSHGATIPIMLNATVTMPHLSFDHSSIDFGYVKIGHCLRKSIVIKNNGYVLAKWSVDLKKKNTYFIRPNTGELLAGKKCLLEIYFMPLVKEFHPAKLYIYTEGNPNQMSINLSGYGIEASLVFDPREVNFNGVLPYTRDNTMILKVQNVSKTPIEFCFADFDEQYKQEKLWISTYFDTHNVKHVLVPARTPGKRLHSIFQDNYLIHISELRKQLMKSCNLSWEDDLEKESFPESPEDPLLKIPPDQVTAMLKGLIESKQMPEDSGSTDVRNSNDFSATVVEPEKKQIDRKTLQGGLFLIFHGGPNTAANEAGKKLKLPVYSIDRIIFEALIEDDEICVNKINILINQEFKLVATQEDLVPVPEEDEYDTLMRKVYVILHNHKNLKPNKKASKEKLGRKSSKTSEKSSSKQPKKKEKESVTLADIPIELFEDLLRYKLQSFRSGLIIESLYSEFLNNKINVALNTVLCAIGNSKYIHIIILSHTLQEYIKEKEEKMINEKTAIKEGLTAVQTVASVKHVAKENLDKETKNSNKTGQTEKSSKKSKDVKKGKTENYEKIILKTMTQAEKVAFETFEQFLNEVISISQFWDKKNNVLIKPSKSKNVMKSDSDTGISGKDMKAIHQKKNLNTIQEQSSEIGILLWVINNASTERCLDFSEMISDLLKENCYLEEVKNALSENLEEEHEESSTLFTVITKTNEKDSNKSDFFNIENYEPENESEVDGHGFVEPRSFVGRRSLVGPRSFLRPKSISRKRHFKIGDKEKNKDIAHHELVARCILQPDGEAYYQITFRPKKYCEYNHSFSVEITELNSNYLINCSAICELPRINLDPYVLFPNVIEYSRDQRNTNFVYIKEMNTFDFGRAFFDSEKAYKYNSKLLLKNISQLPCEVTASLSDKLSYFLALNTLNIDPEHQVDFPLSVKTVKSGLLQSTLCISIKNNPKPNIYNLITTPCKLDFRIKPKTVFFDKVPLNYTLSKKINLSNHSSINLSWRFIDFDWALPIYHISKTEGSLGAFSVLDIVFSYTPNQQESHHKKHLEIQVFDPHYSNEKPVYTDFITLSADSVEYQIEYCDHIDLGEIKGGMEHKVPFSLTNRGSCNTCISFAKIENPLDKDRHIRKFFELKNTNEILIPNKLFTGILIFKPTKAVEFTEVPIFVFNIVECSYQDSIMNSFVIKVSAKVFFSSFEVTPVSEISFGYQQILSTKKQIMELKNTGKFLFTYTIVTLLSLMPVEQKDTEKSAKKGKTQKTATSKSDKESKKKESKGSSKKSKGSKNSKNEKAKKTKMIVACFSIEPSFGELMPGEVAQIQIDCIPQQNKEYKEVICVCVSEPSREDLSGKQITLCVTGCEPLLNFDDFRKIFREQFIIDKLENLNLPRDIESHCIYESSELILHFKNVCVHTKAECKIYIQNVGHVTAHVTTKIEGGNTFKVSPSNTDIQPFSTKSMSIIFKPECVGESNGTLEITYNSSTNNKFTLALVGAGLIPQIRVIEPDVDDNGVINFIPTYIGHNRSQRVCIKNVGSISAKVILEICDNTKEMLALKACEDTYDLLNVCDLEEFKNTKHSTLVNLQPDQIANFDLIFEPDHEDSLRKDIIIHTVNNPFEIAQITVNANSYYHDLYMEGLIPCIQDTKGLVGYDIDFGLSTLNFLQKKYFSIINNSDQFTYKFEFTNFGPLIFTPRVGHLRPLARKEMVVIFSSRIPRHFKNELVECTVHKIKYVDPKPEPLSWDDRQKFTLEICNLDESVVTNSHETLLGEEESESVRENLREEHSEEMMKTNLHHEPDFEIIPGSSEVIPCFLSIIADYSTYICNVHEISFLETFINEKNEMNFEIKNSGMVPLDIEWTFSNNEIVHSRAVSAKDKNNKSNCDKIKNDLKRSSSATSLFSSDSYSCVEEQKFPFTITPQKILVSPKKIQQFSINFSPFNLSQYCVKLQSNIICLKSELENIAIKVTGTSLLPTHYFEIEDSDYLNRIPDGVKKCGSHKYADVKIIEFESLGIGVLSIRKFNVVNPGNEIFSYKFHSLEEYPAFSYFDCKTPTGFVTERKKSEIVFTFKPQEFGNFEGYYMFKILEKNTAIPFLLAGKCRPPSVYFTKSHISIQPTVLTVHSSTTAVLRNNEDTYLSFKVLKESLLNDNQDQELDISPKSGKLGPKSEQHIKLIFKAEKIGNVTFHIQCAIEKVPTPLSLNIFTQCVEVLPLITYIDKFDGVTNSLNKDSKNNIYFGTLIPQKREMLKFVISNIGKTGFFYTIQFNSKPIEHLFYFGISQEKDFVPSGKQSEVMVYLQAFKKATLQDFKVKINISYGPTYLLYINANAEEPLVKFSFQTYNFGCCIVQKRRSNHYNVSLELKNIGTGILLIENDCEDTDNLTVDFKCSQVRPSRSQHISIYFHPLQVGQYEINVPLKINSVKYVVKILGEAVNINLQLVNRSDKYIDLGGVMVGAAKHYAVQVINRTSTHINVFFDLWQRLPFHTRPAEKLDSGIKVPEKKESLPQKSLKKLIGEDKKGKGAKPTTEKGTSKGSKKSNKKEKGKNINAKKGKDKKKKKESYSETVQEVVEVIEEPKKTVIDFLKISPRDCIQIGPDKKYQFDIDFIPTERIGSFSEQIFYEVQDHIEPLCVVKGYCIAPKFVLSEDILTFSNIVVGLRHSMNILLRNIGDLRGRFEWVLGKGMDDFRITPCSGFVGPSSVLKICITYAPKKADCVLKTKAKCLIEGLGKPLELTLEGASTKIPSPESTLYFSCPVRETTKENVKIVNRTLDKWNIHPTMSSNQFLTKKEIIVEAESEYTLDITYNPVTMTNLTPHNGILFLPLPEGKAIVYKLIGQTLPPLPIQKLKLDIKAKTNCTEPLLIKNWLPLKQCFKVVTELITPATPKCLYKISGNPLVELLPQETKNYYWKIYVINDIPLDFKVIFTNIDTNEYMYYEISTNVVPGAPLETITVSTCVRKPVEFTITLDNPIDIPVTFTIDCHIPESTFDKYVTVDSYTSYKLPVQYCPLKTDHITTNLQATCPELGTFIYCINLTATPPVAEHSVKFKAELGEKVFKSILWKNTFKVPVELSAKFDHPAVFSTEKIPQISEGETARIKFSFEPSHLGILQSKGILFSSQTGNYIYPLVGECFVPTPKGPYSVKPGGSTLINFINPFVEDQLFRFEIDSNAFYLKTNSEIIKAKKSTNIVVNMQSSKYLDLNKQSCQITGKLYVEAVNGPVDDIKWVFYIQNGHI